MSTITLLKGFNNYYNRIRKIRSSLSAYRSAASSYATYSDINFYSGDGVSAKQTLNTSLYDADYLIVSNGSTIQSRWFILHSDRNRKGQTIFELRRDLLVDMQSPLNDAWVYIEKGALSYTDMSKAPDPAFYLSEDLELNKCFISRKFITNDAALTQTIKSYVVMYVAIDGEERAVDATFTAGTAPQRLYTFPAERKPAPGSPYAIYYYQMQSNGWEAASAISQALSGAGVLYDIQLLPYSPPHSNSSGDISPGSSFSGYPTLLKATDANTEWITDPISLTGFNGVNGSVTAKTCNQCDMIRIASPGEASAFEFNPFKLGWYKSNENRLKIVVTFKPVQPYIHILPNRFCNLYSDPDDNSPSIISKDPRGLIVAGDFSLPVLIDRWTTYEINNKNYMNSFNRQVESLEYQNNLSRNVEGANAILSSVGAGIAQEGVAQGLAASGLSLAAGAYGVVKNAEARAEALDLTRDQFNYSLQNIQAMPILLGRTSSFVYDSQICPTISFYTCSDAERNALKLKLKYNGMKIMRIGKFSDYVGNLNADMMYMKCKLIRIDLRDDYHIVNELGNELNKGFYVEIQ